MKCENKPTTEKNVRNARILQTKKNGFHRWHFSSRMEIIQENMAKERMREIVESPEIWAVSAEKSC